MTDFGISSAPSMWLISHSTGSRTSIRAIFWSESSSSRSSAGVTVESCAASAASSDSTPQNSS